MYHSQLTNPIAGETSYWARDIELARVHQRFIFSFGLRCGDEYDTTGELIGPYAAVDRGDPGVAGDTNSRLMREFKRYLAKAKKINVLPDIWSNIDDHAATLTAASEKAVSIPIDESIIDAMDGPDEVEILRRIAADILGDRVESVDGGN